MSKNANQSKQYRIYVKETNNWWDVNKEFYTNYYCDINAYRKRQQEHSRCVCSASKRYLCDMDCLTCPYVKAGELPLKSFLILLHLIDDLPYKVHRLVLHQQAGIHRFGMPRSHH